MNFKLITFFCLGLQNKFALGLMCATLLISAMCICPSLCARKKKHHSDSGLSEMLAAGLVVKYLQEHEKPKIVNIHHHHHHIAPRHHHPPSHHHHHHPSHHYHASHSHHHASIVYPDVWMESTYLL